MDTRANRSPRRRDDRHVRRAAAALAATVGLGTLTACSGDPAGTGGGGLTDEWAALQEDLGALEERIGALETTPEGSPPSGEPTPAGDPTPAGEPGQDGDPAGNGDPGAAGTSVFEDPEALIGQDVEVRGEVAEVLTAVDVGAAFRVAGDGGGAVVVITAIPPAATLDAQDVVRVSGSVAPVQEETFETDFGIAASTLAEDPAAFLEDIGETAAISATEVEILAEPAD